MLSKRNQTSHKRIFTVLLHLSEDWQKAKLIHGDQGQNNGGVLTK